MLTPFSAGAICVFVSSAVVQPGQVSERLQRQLCPRDAQLMRQLPHRCTLHTQAWAAALCRVLLISKLTKFSLVFMTFQQTYYSVI